MCIMAKFNIAENITGRNEGGYANNPADTGGETYAGISRNNWPAWKGWKYIDSYKASRPSASKLSITGWVNASAKVTTEPVSALVSQFYKQNFWDSMSLDLLNDQQLANSIYDFGVNSGTGRAAKFIQSAVNDLGVLALVVDGEIGSKSISAINNSDPLRLYKAFNKRRKDFYLSIATGSQKQFLSSWLSRLKLYVA